MRCRPRARTITLLAMLVLSPAACQPKVTRLRITDLAQPDQPQQLFEQFDQSVFGRDEDGNVRIVLRSVVPSRIDPRQTVEQLVLIKSRYRPVPGQSPVEATMINASIHYVIATGPSTAAYEGAGFLSYSISRDGKTLIGRIESGQIGISSESGRRALPFGRSQISGELIATNDPRTCARLIRESPVPIR